MAQKQSSTNQESIGYKLDSIYEFASKHGLTNGQAANYLAKFGGIDFLDEFYEIEHTLSFADCIEDLTTICRHNGGNL